MLSCAPISVSADADEPSIDADKRRSRSRRRPRILDPFHERDTATATAIGSNNFDKGVAKWRVRVVCPSVLVTCVANFHDTTLDKVSHYSHCECIDQPGIRVSCLVVEQESSTI